LAISFYRGTLFLVPWEYDGSYGVDRLGSNLSSNNAYLVSQLYTIGKELPKKALTEIEVILAKPLASGDSVVVGYRTQRSGAFTNIDTYNTVGKQNFRTRITLTELVNIQFQIILNDEAELITFNAYA
jgi:hypothetical protein